jgi:hypothetical protein
MSPTVWMFGIGLRVNVLCGSVVRKSEPDWVDTQGIELQERMERELAE